MQRANWDGPDFPGADLAVISADDQPSAEPGRRPRLAYTALVGRGDDTWVVRATVRNLPPTVPPESVAAAGEAFARSLKPL